MKKGQIIFLVVIAIAAVIPVLVVLESTINMAFARLKRFGMKTA